MSDITYQTVITAGLLHDIGKFLQRGDFGQLTASGKHPEVSRDFVTAYREFYNRFCDADLLAELVARHHESGHFPEYLQVKGAAKDIRDYAYMISRADNYSSAERDDSSVFGNSDYRKTGLISVFSRLQLDKDRSEECSYRLERLSPDGAFPVPGRQIVAETPYRKHLKDFGAEFNRLTQDQAINTFDIFYTRLFSVLQCYTWCVPSSTQDAFPDVSLFDHLRTTSAIAAALYRYHEEDPSGVTDNQKMKFQLVVGDLSGIQKHIFRTANSKIAKRLRARSFYLGVLSDVVSHMLLQDWDLPISNLIMSSGGKFYVLIPNTSDAVDKIRDIQRQVDEELLERFQGELALNLASIPLSGQDFQDFGHALARLGRALGARKSSSFREVLQQPDGWRTDLFVQRYDDSIEPCPDCGKVHDQGGECDDCLRDERLGAKLPRATHISFFRDNPQADPIIGDYGITVDIGVVNHRVPPYLVYNLNEKGRPSPNPEIVKHMAKHVPVDSQGQSVSFDTIAKSSAGYRILGCIKADVDNLGTLFLLGLKNDVRDMVSISRVATMSRLLELFFSGWIEQLLSRSKYQNCYTVYSGGDDLLIIGPWNTIIDLAGEIYDNFRRYTASNPNITLSAGISLFKPKYPIDTAIESADGQLDESKEKVNPGTGANRNQISILGQTMSWEEYRLMLAEGKRLASWLQEGQVNSGILYRLREYGDMYQLAVKQAPEKPDPIGWRFDSLLKYDISRNLANRQIRRETLEWFTALGQPPYTLMNLMKSLTTYALYTNRGGENR